MANKKSKLRAQRRISRSAQAMRQQLQQRLQFNPELLKQIARTYRHPLDPGAEALLAQGTVYPLWRDFLLAYRDKKGPLLEEAEQPIRDTFENFGDIDQDFPTWWRVTGREIFKENGEVPVVTVQDLDEGWVGTDGYPKHVTLRIPLTIAKDAILKQVNEVLKCTHMGTGLLRHQHSTARCPLHPRGKYLRSHLERALRVWQLVMDHREGHADAEQMPWWEIGHLAQLAPALDPYHDTPSRGREEARQHLASVARDLFTSADAIMQNAVRGSFPNPKNPA